MIRVPLPNDGTSAEFAGLYYVLSKAFAEDLFDVVNSAIVSKAGAVDWFSKINEAREEKGLFRYMDARDPRFLLDEATYFNSVLRLVIPGIDSDWDLAAKKLKKLLNKWSHHQVEPKATTFLELLYPMSVVADKSGLLLGATIAELIARTRAIRDMIWVPKGEGPSLPEEAQDYAGVVEQKLDQIKQRPPVGFPWIGEPGQRRVKLSKPLNDITENGTSIRSELKPDPDLKIQELLRYYPNGGDLHVDDDGAVLGYIKGDPFLVGWLGPEPDVKDDEIRGFIGSRDFIFEGNDVRDSVTGILLSQVADEPLDSLLETLNSWGDLPQGATLNVTEYGDLVFTTDLGESKKITKVHKGIWFPQSQDS